LHLTVMAVAANAPETPGRQDEDVDPGRARRVSWQRRPMEKPLSYIDLPASPVLELASSSASRNGLRLRGLVVALGCGVLLAFSAWLKPSETGVGTHEQLGLPPCEFMVRTGWPCPTCGMTTSFAALAHGRFALAWRAHPFGAILFVACVVLFLAGGYEALTGRDVLRRLRPGVWWAWVLVVGVMVGWVLKLLIGVATGTLPVR